MSKLVQTCSILFKLVQTCSNLPNLVQSCSNLFKLVQTCSILFKLAQTCSILFKLVQTCSNLFKLVQTCPNLSKFVHTCQNSSKLVQTWSRILQSSSLAFPNTKHDVRCFQSPNVESRILQSAPITKCGVWNDRKSPDMGERWFDGVLNQHKGRIWQNKRQVFWLKDTSQLCQFWLWQLW